MSKTQEKQARNASVEAFLTAALKEKLREDAYKKKTTMSNIIYDLLMMRYKKSLSPDTDSLRG